MSDDAFFNTTGPTGDIIATANDSIGIRNSCTKQGKDIAILGLRGPDARHLVARTVNCLDSFGPRGGGHAPDGCSWKTGGITRIGHVMYLAVARQLHLCSRGRQSDGIQPSFNASILSSANGGRTWTNPWGTTSRSGAAPPWNNHLHRYQAMFPGNGFSAPFFIQYGPGNSRTVDGANRYLYAVSTNGFAYNGSYLHLARVPLGKVQRAGSWQFYHGRVGSGHGWNGSAKGATRVLQARRSLSQPAIQYVPALRRYLLFTFVYSRARSDFPVKAETPYTRLSVYSARKPWGPWRKLYEHRGQRSLWCGARPCRLTREPGHARMTVGRPADWLGLYGPALIQKFVFTRSLRQQAIMTCGDWKNARRYPGELLNRLLVLPLDLRAMLAR